MKAEIWGPTNENPRYGLLIAERDNASPMVLLGEDEILKLDGVIGNLKAKIAHRRAEEKNGK